jgi:hypothetical protein
VVAFSAFLPKSHSPSSSSSVLRIDPHPRSLRLFFAVPSSAAPHLPSTMAATAAAVGAAAGGSTRRNPSMLSPLAPSSLVFSSASPTVNSPAAQAAATAHPSSAITAPVALKQRLQYLHNEVAELQRVIALRTVQVCLIPAYRLFVLIVLM